MPVFIIDKLKPKNNGAFKLIDTLDINHKGYNLEDYIDDIDNRLEQITSDIESSNRLVEIENFNNVLKWRYTDEDDNSWRELIDLTEVMESARKDEIHIGDSEPTDSNIKLWIDNQDDLSNMNEEDLYIPTKMSELENDNNTITLNDLRNNLRLTKEGDSIVLSYNGVVLSLMQLN